MIRTHRAANCRLRLLAAAQRVMFNVIVIVAGFLLVWWLLLYLRQDALLFPADYAPRPPQPRLPQGGEILYRGVDHGRVEAWFLPAPDAGDRNPAPLVVFFHGNAEIIDDQADLVDHYHALGASVLLIEYRGYSRSAGSPGQRAIHEDAAWFLDQALDRPQVDADRVVYHGRSLGGGVAADLVRHRPPAALILESTFLSTSAMARRYVAPPFLLRHPFRTDAVVAAFDGPVLILHGTTDRIVPASHARRLAALARNGRLVELHGEHNYLPPDQARVYWDSIARFLANHGIIDDE